MSQMVNSLFLFDALVPAAPIPNRAAAAIIQDYRDHGGWTGGKTKSVFFTLQEMNDFMTMMNAAGAGGVNVYFGRYPDDDSQTPDGETGFAGRSTVVFVLTGNTKNDDLFDVETPLIQIPVGPGGITFNHGELNP